MKTENRKIGSLVTTKVREKFLPSQLQDLSPQLDTLYVTLNGYSKIPDFVNGFSNVECICDPKNRTRDIAKLLISKEVGSCYFFTFDDDLLYPEDYVSKYMEKFEQYGKRTILCLHGTILKPNWIVYYQHRKVLHYFEPMEKDRIFDLAGTATTAFHTDSLKINFNEIWDYEIGSDLWLAYFAYKNDIPLQAIARKKNWVVCKPGTQSCGTPLYVKVAKDKLWQWRRNRFFRGWKVNV